MRKPSTRKITTPAAATPAKPAFTSVTGSTGFGADAAKQAATSNVAKPATPAVNKPAKPVGSLTRTAATVVAQRTNFNSLTERDEAYIAFFASFAKLNKTTGVVTLSDIRTSGKKPTYNGSDKSFDAGVIVRLTKANVLKPTATGDGFAFTDHGKTLKPYHAG